METSVTGLTLQWSRRPIASAPASLRLSGAAHRRRSAFTSPKFSTLVWFSLCLHGRMGKIMATRPARRGARCQLAGRRRSPLTLWCTVWVAETSLTCGFPSWTHSRRRPGFPSSCTAHRRKQQPRCDVPFLAHGNGGKPRIRLAQPPQQRYGRQDLTLSLTRPHVFPTMRV